MQQVFMFYSLVLICLDFFRFCLGMSGVVDPLQSVEEQELQEDSLETDKAHSPPLLPDQTSVVLSWTFEQVNHWLLHSVPAVPDRLQGRTPFDLLSYTLR